MALDNDELNKRREERKKEKQFYDAQMRLLKIGTIVTAATMVACVAALLITKGLVSIPKPTEPSQPQLEVTEPVTTAPPETTVPEETIPDTVVHFVAGGDVGVTDKLVSAGATLNGYDYSNMFLDVSGVLSGGDLTAVNFEGNLYGNIFGTETASAPPQLMTALRNAGVDLIQTANSYTIHNGPLGLRSTLDGIRGAGMEPVGTFADSEEFQRTRGFTIREVNGIKIAVVAFTKGMNGMGLPAGAKDCVNLLYTDILTYQEIDTEGITRILQDIALEKPDITIALLHWGGREAPKITKSQTDIRDLMLAGGVDAIIGTHSAFVQQIEFDPQRGTVVAYSLGDLMGTANGGILLDLQITKNGKTGEVKLTGCDYVPVYLVDETETGGSMRLLRIREALLAYENRFVDRVSAATYEAMKSTLQTIESRVNKK